MTKTKLRNEQAEATFLAGIVRHPETYWEVNDIGLVKEDFVGIQTKAVMSAIEAVVSRKKQPDLPFIVERVRDDSVLDYLDHLKLLPASALQARESGEIVRALSHARKLQAAGVSIIELSNEMRTDVAGAQADAEALLTKARNMLPVPDRSPEPADIIRRLHEAGPSDTIPITFAPTLQQYTGGFAPGNTWVIGGFSSMGKSAVGVNIAADVLRRRGKWVGIVSLEMTQEQYMIRMLSLKSGIPQRMIRDKATVHLPGMDTGDLDRAERELSLSKLRIFEPGRELKTILSTAKRMKETEGLDVLIVDFLQNIKVGNFDEFASAREGILELQDLAKRLHICVIAFSQISNDMAKMYDTPVDPKTGLRKRKSFYSFKGHGALRDAADVAIMLQRDLSVNSPVLELDVVKNRHDEKGTIITRMELKTGKITETGVMALTEDDDGPP